MAGLPNSSIALQSVTPLSSTTILVQFTQEVLLVSASGINDGFNIQNYSLVGIGDWYIKQVTPVTGNARAVKLNLTGALPVGDWVLTVANIQSVGGGTLQPPTALPFQIFSGSAAIPASGGAVNDSAYNIIAKHLGPGLLTVHNKGWRSLVSALAYGVNYLTYVGQAAFPQMFLSTATGIYLTYLAGSEGISRPPGLGISDKLFRELAIQVRTNKLTENAYLGVLKIFFGADTVQAYSLSALFEPYALSGGEDLRVTIDEQQSLTIIIPATGIQTLGQATALEISAIITQAFQNGGINAEAFSIRNSSTGLNQVKMRSRTLGLASAVRVSGGTAQNKLQFPTLIQKADTVRTWTITNPYPGIARWTTTNTSTVDLSLMLPGDYFIVTGSNFNVANRDTWLIDSVSVSYPGGLLTQSIDVKTNTSFAQAGVVIASANDIIFYRSTKATTQSGNQSVIVAHLDSSKTVNVVMPVTSQTVNRTLGTGAYLQPINTPLTGTLIERFDDGSMNVTTSTNHNLVTGQQIVTDGWKVGAQHIPYTSPPGVVSPTGGGESQHAPFTMRYYQAQARPTAGVSSYTQTRLANDTILMAGGGQLTYLGSNVFGQPIVSATTAAVTFSTVQTGTESTGIGVNVTWGTPTAMGVARMGHTATLLNNGKVLVAGGHNGAAYVNSTEIYDPTGGGSWVAGPNMSNARMLHTAVLLPSGKVLLIGGFTANTTPSLTCDLYDPVANTITPAGALLKARGGHSSILLPSNKVLAIGGRAYNSLNTVTVTTQVLSCELYDPVGDAWALDSPLDFSTWLQQPVLVGNQVFIIANGVNSNNVVAVGQDGFNLRCYDSGRWRPITHAIHLGFNPFDIFTIPKPDGSAIYVPERNEIIFDTASSEGLIFNLNDGTLRTGPLMGAVINSVTGAATLLDGHRAILCGGGTGGAVGSTYSANAFITTLNADVTLDGHVNGLYTVSNIVSPTIFTVQAPNSFAFPSYTTATGGTVTTIKAAPGIWAGPYMWDPDSGVGITAKSSTTTLAIAANSNIQTLQVTDATQFTDETGYLVFGFGTAIQTGPVKYLGRQDATHLVIDFTFTFPYELDSGTKVTQLHGKGAFVPADPVARGSFWLTENAAGRLAAIDTISSIAASGALTNFVITYPNDFGLGGAGSPTHGVQKLSSIVNVYAGNDINVDLEWAREH
jgi:hypothetical protein